MEVCYIPVFPIGGKQLEIRCKNCGNETRVENIVKKYEKSAKTPFYLYSALILFVGLAAFWFYWNKNKQKHTTECVENPAVADVYTISEEKNIGTSYYFVKADTLVFRRKDLREMLEKDEIYSVKRNYGDGGGFNRIR